MQFPMRYKRARTGKAILITTEEKLVLMNGKKKEKHYKYFSLLNAPTRFV